MPIIEIPANWNCQRCGDRPVTIADGHALYCGTNCALHDESRHELQELLRLAQQGRAGSPEALALLETVTDHLSELQPIRPDKSCEKCWGVMQGGHAKVLEDYSQVHVDRCAYCGWERSAKSSKTCEKCKGNRIERVNRHPGDGMVELWVDQCIDCGWGRPVPSEAS